MKRSTKIASAGIIATSLLVFCLPSTAVAAPKAVAANNSASTTMKGALPNGKPFQYLNSRISALQAQIDLLIGRVSSLEEWQVKAQQALETLELNVAKNAAAIALLEGEIADIKDILATKQDIINGECPAGQYLYKISSTEGLVCRADIGANGLGLFSVTVVPDIAPTSTTDVAASCPAGSVPTGGSFNAAGGLIVNFSGIKDLGFNVNVTNPTPSPLPLTVTATCLAVNP